MKHSKISRFHLAKLLSVSLAGSAFMLQPAMASMPDTHIGSTGFQQSTRVGSDLNQIHDTITINAALSGGNVSGMSGSGIQSSLDSLRGLRAPGAL